MICAPESLLRHVGPTNTASRSYRYLSFDDDVVRAGAETDPVGFIADLPETVVLDEVQRVPGLCTSLKLEFDRRPAPGRFVLTGSMNVPAVPTVQDSLAGRGGTLGPLARCPYTKHQRATRSAEPEPHPRAGSRIVPAPLLRRADA